MGGGESATNWCNLWEMGGSVLWAWFFIRCPWRPAPVRVAHHGFHPGLMFRLFLTLSLASTCLFPAIEPLGPAEEGERLVSQAAPLQSHGNVSLNVVPPSGDPQNPLPASSNHPDCIKCPLLAFLLPGCTFPLTSVPGVISYLIMLKPYPLVMCHVS